MPLSPPSNPIKDDDKTNRPSTLHGLIAEDAVKPGGGKPEDALSVHRGAIRVPSPDPSVLSMDDSNNVRYGRSLNSEPLRQGGFQALQHRAEVRTWRESILGFWVANKGLALVLISQFFGTLMNVTTRMLEMEGNNGRGYHPFQILFARMSITSIASSYYMWYKKTEHFPFGMREVRMLLIARGLLGFFGVFGMYYSLLYLPLADATVITFLAPSLACWACSYLIAEPFTRMEQIAAYISLFGVILIARPFSFFAAVSHPIPTASDTDATSLPNTTAVPSDRLAADYDAVTPMQRATAVGIAMLGVVGAAGAYTTIRWIGKRAHPLISVNYFAVWCTLVSIVAMLSLPGVGFLLPRSLKDWCYLVFLGLCGFIMQFLLAAGLQYEKSSRATNMVYMQMLFALTFDKLVWGTTPGTLSIVGSSLILGSAIYVAMNKEQPREKAEARRRGDAGGDGDEEVGLIGGDEEEEAEEIGMRSLR